VADHVQAKIEGLGPVIRDLRRFGNKDVPLAIKAANLDAAKAVEPTAKAEAPHRSGRLAASTKATATQKAGALRAGSRGKARLYAGPIHFGWWSHHIKPNPFLYRAVDKRIGEVFKAYEKQIEKAIARFNG
jgi:hypothetical protein